MFIVHGVYVSLHSYGLQYNEEKVVQINKKTTFLSATVTDFRFFTKINKNMYTPIMVDKIQYKSWKSFRFFSVPFPFRFRFRSGPLPFFIFPFFYRSVFFPFPFSVSSKSRVYDRERA